MRKLRHSYTEMNNSDFKGEIKFASIQRRGQKLYPGPVIVYPTASLFQGNWFYVSVIENIKSEDVLKRGNCVHNYQLQYTGQHP